MRVVVNFSRNPSEEWESLVGLAETSRNVIELARLYQWGRSHYHPEVSAAAKKRALQLGYRVSQLEADQRGILRRENPIGFDAQDIRREADKAAREMMRSVGMSSRAVRSMERDSILSVYGTEVRYGDFPAGFDKAWLEGWRKGYGDTRRNLTDRAQRYRANAEPPDGPKACLFCGTRSKLMVGHLNGRESDNTPDNLHWTCRSCNTLHGNALKRARMGKRTAQFNPTKSGGASNVGEWMQAVGAIRPHKYPDKNAGLTSTMKVADAVAMIRATPAHKRSEFASKLASSRSGRRGGGSSEVPF